MLIGLISDSHDHLPHIKQAVQIFRQHQADKIFHAGDYCSPFTIEPFKGLSLSGVIGKNDGDHSFLRQEMESINGTLDEQLLELNLADLRIAVYNGIEPPITEALEECGNYDVVISGHTHTAKTYQVNNTLAINPGTAHGFGEEATIGLFNTDSMKVDFITLYR